jgi:hypothetical protein
LSYSNVNFTAPAGAFFVWHRFAMTQVIDFSEQRQENITKVVTLTAAFSEQRRVNRA